MLELTVVTVTFNDLPGLKATIDSVRALERTSLEHIVIDGSSTDGTVEYLKSAPVTRYLSESDRGIYDAMNKGIHLATGHWVWFMNAGDRFACPSSARMLIDATQEAGAAWGHGLSRVTDAKGRTSLRGFHTFDLKRFSLGGRVVPHQATVYKRTLLERIGGYSENFPVSADQHLMLAAGMESLPAQVPDVLCEFDGSGVGSRRRAWEHYRDMSRISKDLHFSATGSTAKDVLASVALATATTVERGVNRWLR